LHLNKGTVLGQSAILQLSAPEVHAGRRTESKIDLVKPNKS